MASGPAAIETLTDDLLLDAVLAEIGPFVER